MLHNTRVLFLVKVYAMRRGHSYVHHIIMFFESNLGQVA